jgi:hypothetical protein
MKLAMKPKRRTGRLLNLSIVKMETKQPTVPKAARKAPTVGGAMISGGESF